MRNNAFMLVVLSGMILAFIADVVVFATRPEMTVSAWMQQYCDASPASFVLFCAAGSVGAAFNSWAKWGCGSFGAKAKIAATLGMGVFIAIFVDFQVYLLNERVTIPWLLLREHSGAFRSALLGFGSGLMAHHWLYCRRTPDRKCPRIAS